MSGTTSEYVRTEIAFCPNCERRVPGHVRHYPSDHVGWTCPACHAAFAADSIDGIPLAEVLATTDMNGAPSFDG
ncbi:MAG: hypothetical protein ABEJ86_00935 [Halococcoides sp.]